MAKTPEDWWPELLRDFAQEDPWSAHEVVVAEVRNYVEGPNPGVRRVAAGLAPVAQLDALRAHLASVGHEVDASGPRPSPSREGYEPRFWLFARGLPDNRCEPLILSWEAGDAVVHTPSPEFVMTYGLVPRSEGGGAIVYDDPRGPTPGVIRVAPPACWDFPNYTPSSVKADRDYVQDYLSLRGMALVQGFYLNHSGPMDAECDALLGSRDVLEIKLPARTIELRRERDSRGDVLSVQVWGGRIVAEPGPFPVSVDLLRTEGLLWPGIAEPVTRGRARKLQFERVYVRDAVLGAYEGQPGFSVHPLSGGVAFRNQWSVSYCDRVGRDTIRLEVKKLYEGSPDVVIRHWHAFAVAGPQGEAGDKEASIGTRARDLTYAVLALGECLADLAARSGLDDLGSEDFVRLDRRPLAYAGWWNGPGVEPITRHVPLNLSRDDFLDRCRRLDHLTGEALKVASLRRLLRALGAPREMHNGLDASLKLLDLLLRMAGVAREQGFQLPADAARVINIVASQTLAPRPLVRLFALNDLRNLASHREDAKAFASRFRGALDRFGIEADREASGYGHILDAVYEALTTELTEASDTVAAAISG